MKHIVIIFLLGTFTFLGQSKIDRDLGDFSKVAVYDGINLELVKSEENKVEITGKNTNFVVVKNKNGDLKIRLNLERRFSGDKTKVTLFYKTLYNSFNQLLDHLNNCSSTCEKKDLITAIDIIKFKFPGELT